MPLIRLSKSDHQSVWFMKQIPWNNCSLIKCLPMDIVAGMRVRKVIICTWQKSPELHFVKPPETSLYVNIVLRQWTMNTKWMWTGKKIKNKWQQWWFRLKICIFEMLSLYNQYCLIRNFIHPNKCWQKKNILQTTSLSLSLLGNYLEKL